MPSNQDDLYQEAAAGYGAALDRLAGAYEANPEERRDLLQDIHLVCGGASAPSTGVVPFERGYIESLTT